MVARHVQKARMTEAANPDHLAGALRLAELLSERLCHDLSGSLGSLAGAVELAVDDLASRAEALSIATELATTLTGRLKLFRAAWGSDCGALSPAEIAALTTGHTRRVSLNLTGVTDGSLPGPVARLMLNLLLLGIEALPGGGTLTATGAIRTGLALVPRGPRAAWPAGFAALLVSDDIKLPYSPRGLLAPLVVLLARDAGLRLTLLMASSVDEQPAPLLLSCD